VTTDTASDRPSILIVDDTVENLRLLVSVLGERGYETRPVTSGADALRAAAAAPPDLILLDVTMPGMNGFEVCEALKADPMLRDVPVVFLTALTDVQDKVAGFAAGGVDYITKPFHIEEIAARVATHVALKRAREALATSLARLQSLERLRDDLVRMIVHDMRGLLLVVLANLDLAMPELDGQARADVGEAAGAAHAVNRMANELLDVSRLEEGKMPLVREPTNVAELCEHAVRAARALDTSRSIDASGGPAFANCDAGLVRRVIDNLVSNAVKHTPPAGTVHVTSSFASGQVRVSVTDDGPGVPEELRPRLFEKFTAARKSNEKYHSAGLGLAFCKLAVEAHGGTIRVEPATPRGTVFTFEIPA
jgi:signal transduction histidine kinase